MTRTHPHMQAKSRKNPQRPHTQQIKTLASHRWIQAEPGVLDHRAEPVLDLGGKRERPWEIRRAGASDSHPDMVPRTNLLVVALVRAYLRGLAPGSTAAHRVRRACRIPEQVRHRTKPRLALDQLEQMTGPEGRGLPHLPVVADRAYGGHHASKPWPGEPEATHHRGHPTYRVAPLPPRTDLAEPVRLAKIRRRIEHDCREFEDGLGLDRLEGRGYTDVTATPPSPPPPRPFAPFCAGPESPCPGLSVHRVPGGARLAGTPIRQSGPGGGKATSPL